NVHLIYMKSAHLVVTCCRYMYVFCFFFSSRRRHTRSKRDWSSDVCSSDLRLATKESIQLTDLHDDLFLHYDSLQSPALYHLLEDACNDVGFRPKTICTGSELLTMASMIAHNVGVTLLPQDMLELVMSPNLKALHLEDVRLESSIAIIWRDDGDLYDHKHTFIQQLQHLECVVK